MKKHTLTVAMTLICTTPSVLATPAATPARPPATPIRPVEETIHGVKITDNYRWLEGDNSDPANMGKMTDEVAAWTDAQNAYTRKVLDNLPGRARVEATLRPLMEIGNVSAPIMRGNFYFYSKREGDENQPKVFVREGANGVPRLLLDPDKIDPTGLTHITGLAPSPDGKLLGFGMYRAGDENSTVYVLNVATGVWLADQIEGKARVIEWLPDSSGFFYHRLADPKDPYSARIMFHVLGQHPRQDKLLFRQYTKEENEKLATTWGPSASISRDGKWMCLVYFTGTNSNDIWLVNLEKWFKDGTFDKQVVKVGAPNNFYGDFAADDSTFYMVTDDGAPNKKIVAVDPLQPDEAHWKTFVPENPEAVITGFSIVKNGVLVSYEEKATNKFRLFDFAGRLKGELRQPGLGSADISAEPDRTEAFLAFTSFNYPTTIFHVDLAHLDAEPVVWERPAVPVDPSIIEVKQVTYHSKDGTPVTMFIVHKKGLRLDGNNPTVVTGYGGFGISQTPAFSPTLYPFFQDGGVFAMANLRGGGEYGKAWHDQGMLEHKQNVFDDMIAAAEWLIKNKYTRPERLEATGGSNGGLLMGALITQRPDLFRAIICGVPLLDMLRYQDFLMGRYWAPEYGTAEDPEAFKWLLQYSPYQHVKKGVHYPAVFFTAGEHDTRVHPMHARKMAAELQAATASDPATEPILLWVDRESGHGMGKPLNIRLREAVDMRMFMMWQLGMLEEGKN